MSRIGPALLPDGAPPDDGLAPSDRIARAATFFPRFGWPKERIWCHLMLTDWTKPVHEVLLLPPTQLGRAPQGGNYFLPAGAASRVTEPIPALQSYSTSGAVQLFLPDPFFGAIQPRPTESAYRFESIRDANNFVTTLTVTLSATEERIASNARPDARPIRSQLQRIQGWWHSGLRPSGKELKSLTLGMLAIRDWESLDARYAYQLQVLHAHAIRWCDVPISRLLLART